MTCMQQIFILFFGQSDQWQHWLQVLSKSCDPTGRSCLPGCKKATAMVCLYILLSYSCHNRPEVNQIPKSL